MTEFTTEHIEQLEDEIRHIANEFSVNFLELKLVMNHLLKNKSVLNISTYLTSLAELSIAFGGKINLFSLHTDLYATGIVK